MRPPGCFFRCFLSSQRGKAIVIAIVSVLGLLLWSWVPAGVASDCHFAENGAWISVDWTSQPVDADAVADLAQNASLRRFHYLFPFTTYVKADGSPSASSWFDRVGSHKRCGESVFCRKEQLQGGRLGYLCAFGLG